MPARTAPELTHRDVRPPSVGFNRKCQAVPVTDLPEVPSIVIQQQITHSSPEVPQKALGHLPAVNKAPCEGGQVGEQIIAATFLKFLPELRCPVLRTHFPTVAMRHLERASSGSCLIFEEFPHKPCKLDFDRPFT